MARRKMSIDFASDVHAQLRMDAKEEGVEISEYAESIVRQYYDMTFAEKLLARDLERARSERDRYARFAQYWREVCRATGHLVELQKEHARLAADLLADLGREILDDARLEDESADFEQEVMRDCEAKPGVRAAFRNAGEREPSERDVQIHRLAARIRECEAERVRIAREYVQSCLDDVEKVQVMHVRAIDLPGAG